MTKFDIVEFPFSNPATKEIDQSDPLTTKYRYISCAVMALLIIPINIQKSLATLRYFSVVILVVMMYTIVLILAQFPSYYLHYKNDPGYAVDWVVAEPQIKWFQGFATLMLSYNCQVLFFYVRGEMMHKSQERVTKLVVALTSICMTLFTFMCVAAYLSLGKNYLPKLFTLRRKIDPSDKDILMSAAQILFFVASYFKISLLVFPAREQLNIFYKLSRNNLNHAMITVIMTVVMFTVPAVFPDVTNLLGLLGGVTVGTVGYLIPVLLKLASYRKERDFGLGFYAHLLLGLGIFTIQCTSTTLSIQAALAAKK